MWRRIRRVGGGVSVAWLSIGFYGLYHDKPVADDGKEQDLLWCARTASFPSILLAAPRFVEAVLASAISKVYLKSLNSWSSTGDQILMGAVKHRKPGQGLITVSNHTATVDDPSLFATLLPWNVLIRPSLNRWTLCSQEYCFQKGEIIATLFHGAKTLPIKRGAGINHVFLEQFFNKLEAGEWVHIFPEGKICQDGTLTGRPEPLRSEIGRLKWGVGKLIARASETPLVIPIYHVGMDKVMPQDKDHKLKSVIPRVGQSVRVIVGDPIPMDDIVDEYRKLELKPSGWTTTAEEKTVYSAITKRIENALLELEKKLKDQEVAERQQNLLESAQRHKSRLESQ